MASAGGMTEEEIDWYLLAASQKYEAEVGSVAGGKSQALEEPDSCSLQAYQVDPASRFGPVVGSNELQEMIDDSVPHETRQHTKWCISTWNEWRESRIALAKGCKSEIPPS